MLIKKQKLTKIKSLHPIDAMQGINIPQESTTRALQIEIHKAKQEAQAIKNKAQALLKEAESQLEEAELEARDIISSAKQEAEEIKKKTYIEAKNKAYAEANIVKEQAQNLMAELFEVKRETLHQAHTQIINIALDLAEKILKHQANIDTNTLKTQVVEAIKKATTEADHVKVYVNSEEQVTLQNMIPEIKSLFPSEIEIIPFSDESIDKGSCIVETKSGQLDATFTTQLETLTALVSHLEIEAPDIDSKNLEPAVFEEPVIQESVEEQTEDILDFTEELTVQSDPLTEKEEMVLEDEILSDEPLVNKREEKTFDLEARLDEESLPPSSTFNLEETLEAESLPPVTPEIKESLTDIEDALEEKQFPIEPKPVEEKAFNLEARLDEESLPPTPAKEKKELIPENVLSPEAQIDDDTEVPQARAKIKESPKNLPSSSGKKKLQISTEETNNEDDEVSGFEELEEDSEEDKINTASILKPKEKVSTEQQETQESSSDVSSIANEIEKSPEWENLIHDDDDE